MDGDTKIERSRKRDIDRNLEKKEETKRAKET